MAYPDVVFAVVGDSATPRRWRSTGQTGPLRWRAEIRLESEAAAWTLQVDGTLTGSDTLRGTAPNAYSAGDACRAALRGVIDDHNRFGPVAGP